ncbi:hypothetical protein CHS0354_024010 [Potamilus streckersoni]|uniref:Uncharacterized protein n=1 Tax=Potamilus streckersoni TaxID=2493646 RepID=A0AAE0VLA1_9BIVA|nr:hypothetical protein CHS0354_024010 [Potamilus streckersoni]
MRVHSIRIGFRNETQADFLHLAGEIITKMTENASLFPNLPVQLKQVTAERDAFRDVFNSSEHVGRTGELHNTRKALEESLRKNGKYVNDVANGNEEILEKSGYPMAKEPSPHGEIPAPTEAGVSLNPDGGFDIWATLVDKRYNGVLFAFTEVSNPDDDPATWRTHYAPIPDTTIRSGYTKGKEYKFAVTFLGSSEMLHWFKLDMSDKELRDYIAGIAVIVKETSLLLKKSRAEFDERLKKEEEARVKNEEERKKRNEEFEERLKKEEEARVKNEEERKKRNEELEERLKKEEEARVKNEEERKKRNEEFEERLKKEEEARVKNEEERKKRNEEFEERLRKSHEEFNERLKKEEEARVKRNEELEERLKKQEEERKKNEEERKKRNEEFEERLRKSHEEFNERLKKEEEARVKNEEERKKRDEALSEKIEALSEALSEKIESLWVQIRKTESMMNRFGFNVGSGVEEYFYNTLKSRMSVANIQFEYCERNLKGRNESGEDDEFDIVMKNGTKGVLVECKHRVRKEDVSKMQERKINNFRQSFPGDAKLEMYIALAGISFEPKAEEEAKRAGMILLKQVGERLIEEADNVKVY